MLRDMVRGGRREEVLLWTATVVHGCRTRHVAVW